VHIETMILGVRHYYVAELKFCPQWAFVLGVFTDCVTVSCHFFCQLQLSSKDHWKSYGVLKYPLSLCIMYTNILLTRLVSV